MRKSAGLISTSMFSSTSGYTNTLANDVCRRASPGAPVAGRFKRPPPHGVHEHARERRVPAGVRIERRLAHQAMHAALGAQMAVGVAAADLEGRALDAGDLARRLLEHVDAVALAVAV